METHAATTTKADQFVTLIFKKTQQYARYQGVKKIISGRSSFEITPSFLASLLSRDTGPIYVSAHQAYELYSLIQNKKSETEQGSFGYVLCSRVLDTWNLQPFWDILSSACYYTGQIPNRLTLKSLMDVCCPHDFPQAERRYKGEEDARFQLLASSTNKRRRNCDREIQDADLILHHKRQRRPVMYFGCS